MATKAASKGKAVRKNKYEFVQLLSIIDGPGDSLDTHVRLMRSNEDGKFYVDIRKCRPNRASGYFYTQAGVVLPVDDIENISNVFNIVADAVKSL